MPRYVALLRGINVGRHKRLAMSDLRELLGAAGHSEVRTHLQSGNALFTSQNRNPERLAGEIEARIKQRLGLDVRCLIRSRDEFHAVIDGNTLSQVATDGSRMLALFLSETPRSSLLAAHDPTELARVHIRIGERVVYQWCPDGILAAPNVREFLEKHLNVVVTSRNWNTVTKLSAMLDGDAR